MPPRSWRLRIDDILAAVDAILQYTGGMDRTTFAGDRRTVDAVVRNLIVIGEAAAHVPDDVVAANPQIPWTRMRGMRNLADHEYFGLDPDILWDTVTGNLPGLIPELRRLIEP